MSRRFFVLAALLFGLFLVERVDSAMSLPGVALAAALTVAVPAAAPIMVLPQGR